MVQPHAVLIACPIDDTLVATGTEAVDLAELPAESILEQCPSCGMAHPWRDFEAVIAPIEVAALSTRVPWHPEPSAG